MQYNNRMIAVWISKKDNLMNHTTTKTRAITVGMITTVAVLIGTIAPSIQLIYIKEHRYRKEQNESYAQTETRKNCSGFNTIQCS